MQFDEIDWTRCYIVLSMLINGFITISGLATLVCGVFVGYLFHNGENELMFVPLGIGFATLCVTYFFLEARDLLRHGDRVEGF